MKQLEFVMRITLVLGWLITGAACAEVNSNTGFEEGKHYQRLSNEIAEHPLIQELLKDAEHKVQVLELFSYGCGWCFRLDPYIEKWRSHLPSYIRFQRIPVEFQPAWGNLTKAYYTAQDLKALDKIHAPLFEAVQSEQIKDTSAETLRLFFVSKGIKDSEFSQAFESFDVNRKQKWANAIVRAYRITAVPAIIIQGPKGIYLTALKMAGNEESLLQVMSYLAKIQYEAEQTPIVK